MENVKLLPIINAILKNVDRCPAPLFKCEKGIDIDKLKSGSIEHLGYYILGELDKELAEKHDKLFVYENMSYVETFKRYGREEAIEIGKDIAERLNEHPDSLVTFYEIDKLYPLDSYTFSVYDISLRCSRQGGSFLPMDLYTLDKDQIITKVGKHSGSLILIDCFYELIPIELQTKLE